MRPHTLPPELFAARWVHAFEQDRADGMVFLPEDADFPLSRRPRMQFRLAPDGTATLYLAGPADAAAAQAARWHEADGVLLVNATGGRPPTSLRIVERAPGRLLVRTSAT